MCNTNISDEIGALLAEKEKNKKPVLVPDTPEIRKSPKKKMDSSSPGPSKYFSKSPTKSPTKSPVKTTAKV